MRPTGCANSGSPTRTPARRLGAIIVVMLALGIAANSIIFSAVRAVVLRPLPYHQPEWLVQVWESGPRAGGEADWVSFPDFRDWRAANRVFEEIAARRFALPTLSGGREPEAALGIEVVASGDLPRPACATTPP